MDESEETVAFDAAAMVPAEWHEHNPGTIPVRVVTIIEYIDGVGGTGVTAVVSNECPPWATLGLIGWLAVKVRDELSRTSHGFGDED